MDGAEEFDNFVRAKRAALVRSAYLLTGDRHLAEDLVQSALARTHRGWSRLSDPANAEAYTRKVMYHLQVSWWRRNRVAESMTDETPEPRPSGGPGEATGLTNRMTIHGALAKLSPKQRAVLVYRYFEDRTEAETAELMGVHIGTVKSQTAKALVRLRAVAPELAELYAARVAGAIADDDDDEDDEHNDEDPVGATGGR
ncbi:MAG TPA: SigE family RNA polymerase sigma factor [Micromonosporaceae bacterium]|jgi:RNA polymerase sigma-70 factor (sigma-E family)|nr:SigE family RNA polymerase sigma factor [Micromonosporaceae bacterium]